MAKMASKHTTADILDIAGVTPEVVRISMKIPKPGGRNAVLALETSSVRPKIGWCAFP